MQWESQIGLYGHENSGLPATDDYLQEPGPQKKITKSLKMWGWGY